MLVRHEDFDNATDLIRFSPHSSRAPDPTDLEALPLCPRLCFAGCPNLDAVTR